jgi:hypothetical protein
VAVINEPPPLAAAGVEEIAAQLVGNLSGEARCGRPFTPSPHLAMCQRRRLEGSVVVSCGGTNGIRSGAAVSWPCHIPTALVAGECPFLGSLFSSCVYFLVVRFLMVKDFLVYFIRICVRHVNLQTHFEFKNIQPEELFKWGFNVPSVTNTL